MRNYNQELLDYLMDRLERDKEKLEGVVGRDEWVRLRMSVLKQLFEDEKLIMLKKDE